MKLPNKIIVKQEIEMFEAFSGFETKNKYSINNEAGQQLLFAYEESNAFKRFFLKTIRPLVLHVIDGEKKEVISLKKPFAFFLPDQKVIENGHEIASIKRKFAFAKNVYDISYKGQTYECKSSLRHPWTFNVFQNSQQIATVAKKWSGIGKEMFTDADTFFVDFGTADEGFKKVLLCLAFAIDLTVFEKSNRN